MLGCFYYWNDTLVIRPVVQPKSRGCFLTQLLCDNPGGLRGRVPPSTASDLVMPRMRAVAGLFILLNTFIGLALGPYVMGELSVSFSQPGSVTPKH